MPQPRDPQLPRLTRLTGIRLQNFKSVRAADIPIRALTVIAGANSAGKSSVLQAVLAMTQAARRRIEGHRFPLNDELIRLGTFASVRHQRADPIQPIGIGLRFASDLRDARTNSAMRFRALGAPQAVRSSREPQPLDICWRVELDSPMADQIGSAQSRFHHGGNRW